MRKYEMLVILDAASESDQAGEIAKIDELLKNLGGTVSKIDDCG